jgi:hypothetical protein
VTSTEVDATIPAATTATPGTDSVVVVNILPSGDVTSNSVAVTVTSPSGPQLAISAVEWETEGELQDGQVSNACPFSLPKGRPGLRARSRR